MKKYEINKRIVKKITDSNLEGPMKQFLLNILEIESKEGRESTRYSNLYKNEIETAYILLRRERK